MSKGNILSPICWSLPPFRFVRPFLEDQRRLKAAMESLMDEEPPRPRADRTVQARGIRNGLLFEKCAEQMGQLYLRVNAIRRS